MTNQAYAQLLESCGESPPPQKPTCTAAQVGKETAR